MQVQRVQNNNYNTNFGATLKINNRFGRMEKAVVEYLEKQFPKRTENIDANIDLFVSGRWDFANVIGYRSKGFTDSVKIHYEDMNEPKETILEGLVNALNGFLIREKGQNKIDALKQEIIDVSDKTCCDSEKEFEKTFSVYSDSLVSHDIAYKVSPFYIRINR